MTTPQEDRTAHWGRVYATRAANSVSWYRPHLDVSLELMDLAGLTPGTRIIDVGGGASTLVDDLLVRGLGNIAVLDIAGEALAVARTRLGARARTVEWITADVLSASLAPAAYDLWHDRAVLHFLTDPADAARYAAVATRAVRSGGHAVIGCFAPDGPERCSGLPVARRSPEDIARLMGTQWTLLEPRLEQHLTPGGAVQSFAYALLRHD